jgi:ubiquinone/menaquinone biosynthesis C-methylase UbiE
MAAGGGTIEREFPEHPLWGRYKRMLQWTPDGVDRLLDAGCSWGYGTKHFKSKAGDVVGLDPVPPAIEVARERYPDLQFVEGRLESAPFESESFDAIVACEVINHVGDERAAFDEMWRLLRPGGVVTMALPHRGPLTHLNPEEYGGKLLARIKRRLPWLLRLYRRLIGSEGEYVVGEPETAPPTRSYTVDDLRAALERSKFRSGYEIVKVARTGFVVETLMLNVHYFLRRVLRGRALHGLDFICAKLESHDYWTSYGPLANNLAVQVSKKPGE